MQEKKLRPEEIAEGAGAKVRRLFPASGTDNLDPFVLFDEFFVSPDAGFPDHPHRGFEAITYLLQGAMHHRDNLGNDGVVRPGGALRFSAGNGIVHSEMPESSETTHGIQLWVNLAGSDKKMPADYQQLDPNDIPETKVDGYRVREIAGPRSRLKVHTPLLYQDIELAPGATYAEVIPKEYAGFAYVVEGKLTVGQTTINTGEAAPVGNGEVCFETGPGARFLLVAGRPHGEPIIMHGSFVD